MIRRVMTLSTLILLALLLVISGCKENVPETDLDRFMARTMYLEGQALTDTLRNLAAGDSPNAAFASYALGNKYYTSAGATAAAQGWGDGTVNAQLDTAEVFFVQAIEQDSTLIEAMVNLGSLWDDRSEQMGSREERDHRLANAAKYYNMALTIEPHDEKARCNLGSMYLRQRQGQKALDEFNKVLAHNPESALAHYNLAIMFAESKIYREALREWELASKYDADGDIGSRSRDNIKIVEDLMNAPEPDLGK